MIITKEIVEAECDRQFKIAHHALTKKVSELELYKDREKLSAILGLSALDTVLLLNGNLPDVTAADMWTYFEKVLANGGDK